MLSKGLRLGVYFFALVLLVGMSFCSFNFVQAIDINQSTGSYKSFGKLGHFDFYNGQLYVIDEMERSFFTVVNNSLGKFIFGSTSSVLVQPKGFIIIDNVAYITNGKTVLKVNLVTSSHAEQRFVATIGKLNDIDIYKDLYYLLDGEYSRIFVHQLDGKELFDFGGPGLFDGQLSSPYAFDIIDDLVYVSDTGNKRVSVFHVNGTFVRSFGKAGEGKLDFPTGIKATKDYVFVADRTSQKVVVFNRTSYSVLDVLYDYGDNITTFFWPMDIYVDESKNLLYVADHGRNHIRVYSYSIPAEKPPEVEQKGDKSLAEAKLAEAKSIIDNVGVLIDIAANYGPTFVSVAKEYYGFAERLFSLKDYEGARQSALQALLVAAQEKATLESQLRSHISDDRGNQVAVYLGIVSKREVSGEGISLLAYESCDSELLSLLSKNDIISAYSKLKECQQILAKIDTEYSNAINLKSSMLFTLLNEFKALQKDLKSANEQYGYKLSFSVLDSLILEFSDKLSKGKLAAAESVVPLIKGEIAYIKDLMVKEDQYRASVAQQIKDISEMASKITSEYPEIYEKHMPKFAKLMEDAKKTPAQALSEAQKLIEVIANEVAAKRELQAKNWTMLTVGILSVVLFVTGILLFLRKKKHQ